VKNETDGTVKLVRETTKRYETMKWPDAMKWAIKRADTMKR
jgi:hypothetical protein